MMKKLMMIILTLISIFVMTGCELIDLSTIDITMPEQTTSQSSTTLTTTPVSTEEPTTEILTTIEPTTGNQTTYVQTTEPPVYTYYLNSGIDTVIRGDSWEDAGLYININGEERVIYSDDEVDLTSLEPQLITYSFSLGEILIEAVRYVSVIERDELSITINPGVDTIYVGQTWIDAGAEIETDHTILVDGTVNNQLPGLYEITYYVQDQYGVITQAKRMVKVLDVN
jgi:hypothetical protein